MKRIASICVLPLFWAQALSQKALEDTTLAAPQQQEKKLEFSIMPYLNFNRNLKFMFGVVPMVMYRLNRGDTISPKSLSGLTAVYTTNKSYFISFFNKFYFKEDTWRAQLFVVNGNHNSQFYIDDLEDPGFYDYGTKTTLISAVIQRQIIKSLYGGIGYSYAHHNTKYENDVQPPSVTTTNGLQLNMLYDTRNAIYYPTQGNKARLRWISFPEWAGNQMNANKVLAEYNTYFAVRDKTDVVAARFSGKFGLGNIAFEQQVSIGGNDIRGYSEGKYRGDGLMALQGEYRYNFGKKMGVVGFAGLATIYGSDNKDFNWGLYPGGGIGYRYKAFKTVKFNVGLDAAVGKDDWGIYFRIGESF